MKAYQLKITIKDSHPPIWRRLIVPAGLTFSQLTLVLNEAIGWCGYHLSCHEFSQLGIELQDKDEFDDGFGYYPMRILDSATHKIDEFLEKVKSYTYTYDFGDDWRHTVQIEKVLTDYEGNFPVVLKAVGETPMEDCGGIWGYYDLLETLNNPSDPDYEDTKEWAEMNAPLPLDVEAINETMKELFELTPERSGPKTSAELYEAFFSGEKFKTIDISGNSVSEDDNIIHFRDRANGLRK